MGSAAAGRHGLLRPQAQALPVNSREFSSDLMFSSIKDGVQNKLSVSQLGGGVDPLDPLYATT